MPEQPTAYKYFAFISYSRKDSKVAAWLQKRLEWFRFPVKLVPEVRRPPHDRYVRPIYRDKTNLEVTDEHYWTNIRRALEESRYLIVLCSPNSAKPRPEASNHPVDMEVAHFLASHDDDASIVAPIILDGNVTSDGADAAFCPALRALGDTLINRNLPTFVPDADTAEEDAWEAGFIALMSYVLALDRSVLGDHIRREERRQLVRNRAMAAALAGLAVVAVLGGIIAWTQRGAAIDAKREVEKASMVIQDKNLAVEKANAEIVKKNGEIKNQAHTNLKNLHEASMADYSVAVHRIEKDGKWHEGVAYLARSLKWEPTNLLSAARLYSTLSFHAVEMQTWPRHILDGEGDDTEEGRHWLSAQFSPDSSRILISGPFSARVWNAATGKPLGESLPHYGIWKAQFSLESTRIITVDYDSAYNGSAQVWDVSTNKLLRQSLFHEDFRQRGQLSMDGERIVTIRPNHTARVWDVDTGKMLGLPLLHEENVDYVDFSVDGTLIVTLSGDAARVWEVATGTMLGVPMRHEKHADSVKFNVDGTRVVTAGDHIARVWDIATGKMLGVPMAVNCLDFGVTINSLEFSADGERFVTADGNAVRVWDADTGAMLGEPLRHEESVYSVDYSPDSTRIVTASGNAAQVWDVKAGKPIGGQLLHENENRSLRSVQFSPDGTRILTTGHDQTVWVWDTPSIRPRGELLDEPLSDRTAMQSRADGPRIVTTSDKNLQGWDLATGKMLGEPIAEELNLGSVQFSADSTHIVIDGKTSWHAAALLHPLVPVPEWMIKHAQSVAGLKFDANGQLKTIPSQQRREEILITPPGDDGWAKLARWLAQPANERTLDPESKFTWRQIAERERDDSRFELALRCDPNVPLAHVLLAGEMVKRAEQLISRGGRLEPDPRVWKRAAVLRNYGLKFIPDDAGLWARAATSLVEQKDFLLGSQAIEKALALDKNNAQVVELKKKLIERQRIVEIKIRQTGPLEVKKSLIDSLLTFKKGSLFTDDVIESSIRAIYATGLVENLDFTGTDLPNDQGVIVEIKIQTRKATD